MLSKVDPRIANMVKKLAGDKLDVVLIQAEDLMLLHGKSTERALADALDVFRLVKNRKANDEDEVEDEVVA